MRSAGAQSSARVQLTDNDLSCRQIYAESLQMDTVMQLAGGGLPAANTATPAIPAQARAANTHASANQVQMQPLMVGSDRADLRAAASDPAKVAQVTATLQNPQLTVDIARTAADGVYPALIQSQLVATRAMQQTAAATGGVAMAPHRCAASAAFLAYLPAARPPRCRRRKLHPSRRRRYANHT